MDKGTVLFESHNGLVDQEELYRVFRAVGVETGDILMVHSRLFTLGHISEGLTKDQLADAFIHSLLDAVGPTGTLIFPTFTLGVCKSGVFDVDNSRSEMGLLSERARLRKDITRTRHPFFSVATIGKHQDAILAASLNTCFGKDSIFDCLHQLNSKGAGQGKVKFLTIGIDTPPEAITYIHAIEEKLAVPYRYHKNFRGTIKEDGHDFPYDVDFYVRDLSTEVTFDKHACWSLLKNQSGVAVRGLGNSQVVLLNEDTLYNNLLKAIQEKDDFLCQGGYQCTR
jgi:aminoglycoside 3-N-acetyltransferase